MDLISILVVLFVTLCAAVTGIYAYGLSNIREIKQNWVQYRCNPVYMPLAGMVGSDILTNFTNCTMQSASSYAGFVMDPIFENFKSLQDVFGYILTSINFIRQKISGTVDGFMGMINSVFGKLQNTLSVTSQLIGRFRTIMNRIVSVFVIMIHIAKTGIATGESVNNGPIGEAARFLCFDPTVPVTRKDGTTLPMKALRPGDILKDGTVVRSVLEFDGKDTEMVSIEDIRVSGNHKILYEQNWIRTEDHPNAVKVPSLPRIMCLNTDSHVIPISGHTFKDYEETDDTDQFYSRVAEYYNSQKPERDNKVTGFHKDTLVVTETLDSKAIKDISIGDRLLGGQSVIGTLVHTIDAPFVDKEGVFCAPGTIYRSFDGIHTVSGYSSAEVKECVCYQLLVQTAQFVVETPDKKYMLVLDDQEVPSYDIHNERDASILSPKITQPT
jgi:hypothetical protein